jgi:hypothetical protein
VAAKAGKRIFSKKEGMARRLAASSRGAGTRLRLRVRPSELISARLLRLRLRSLLCGTGWRR